MFSISYNFRFFAAMTLGMSIAWNLTGMINAGCLEPDQVRLKIEDKKLQIDYQYRRPDGMTIEEFRYYLRTEAGHDLPISLLADRAQSDLPLKQASGRVSFSIPAAFLASGSYHLVVKVKVRQEQEKPFLKSDGWTAMIKLKNFVGKNVEIRSRVRLIEGDQGLWFMARTQPDLGPAANKWKFYFLSGGAKMNAGKSFQTHNWSTERAYVEHAYPYTAGGWHSYVFRCSGNRIEGVLDDTVKVEMTDPANTYSEGGVGIRMGFASCYFDDLVVKDLQTGSNVFDWTSGAGKFSSDWEVLKGNWTVEKGYVETEEIVLGRISVPVQTNIPAPEVKLKPHQGDWQLTVNGTPVVPLLFSSGETEIAPFKDSTARLLRDLYQSGIRLYAPIVSVAADKTGEPDLRDMDDLMNLITLICPDAYIVLRVYLLPPPDLPEAEKTLVTRRPGDTSDTPRDAAGIGKFNASLASEHYRRYAPRALTKVIAHIRSRSYGERVAGMLLAGAGYEGDWGHPNACYGLYMDACPAQNRRFTDFLRTKYKTEEELRKAWDDPAANFTNLPLPGVEDRTVADLAGFRDPAKTGSSRRVSDFLDMYCEQNIAMVKPLFDVVSEHDPDKLYGRFGGLGTCNKAWAGIQLYSAYRHDLLDLSHPGLSFLTGCLGYGDRMAGGTSIYTVQAWESVRRHGKMVVGEADIHTHVATNGEKNVTQTIASMRREFAHTVLIGRQGLWYYDMAYSGPWYEDPLLHDELRKQMDVGKAGLPLVHRSAAEVLVIQDNRSLRYFATSPQPLKKGQDVRLPWAMYAHHQVHQNIESMTRSGVSMDFIVPDDLNAMPPYKLSIFPTQFYCDEKMRQGIHERLKKEGGVCFFFTAAGLLDEHGADLQNMEKLLGMKIKYDGPAALKARSVKENSPILQYLPEGVELDNGEAEWYRFYVDDPEATPLARYADGKVAMAVKKYGRGFMVYSGLPVTAPAVYQAVAKFAGVHIYSSSGDAFFADNQFVMIHTKTGGVKQIFLPRKSSKIIEVFSGENAGRNTGQITVELPAKHTAVYYIGDDPEFINAITAISRK